MSFKVKQPKVTAPPEPPAQNVAPQSLPTSERKRRLSTGGRQSTFLGGLGQAALAGPRASLTGVGG
jgi:hypothetical protein